MCRCPNCNEMEAFTEEMKTFGIYVPEQDASWELLCTNLVGMFTGYNIIVLEDSMCGCGGTHC
jgi:hypothetical protein